MATEFNVVYKKNLSRKFVVILSQLIFHSFCLLFVVSMSLFWRIGSVFLYFIIREWSKANYRPGEVVMASVCLSVRVPTALPV